jgi:hypothetical protein
MEKLTMIFSITVRYSIRLDAVSEFFHRTVLPITATTMNYAAPITGKFDPVSSLTYDELNEPTGAVLLVSGIWYIVHARKFYKGPLNLADRDGGESRRFNETKVIQSDERFLETSI